MALDALPATTESCAARRATVEVTAMRSASPACRLEEEDRLRDLMTKARAGDATAYATLLSAVAARLGRFFKNQLFRRAEDVEDLIQETLLAIHIRREHYDGSLPVTAWVYAIARYKLIDHLRREGLRAHIPIDAVGDLFAPDRTDAGDTVRDLKTLVAQLPEKQRVAVSLMKIEHKSLREAAIAGGMSETSIRVNVHRGMKNLMALIARSDRI